ncbi:hypothetical protein [Mycobacterium sp. C31M]
MIGDDPEDPSLPPVFGARVTDGRLQLSTGTPCQNVSRIVVNFNPGSARLILEPAQGASADVETLTIGGPYPGMEIVEDLPVGFDWKAEQQVLMTVDSEPAGAGATPTSIAELTAGSGDHPADSYYFEGVGWLGPAEVAEGNGTSLLTVCTPDPAAP